MASCTAALFANKKVGARRRRAPTDYALIFLGMGKTHPRFIPGE